MLRKSLTFIVALAASITLSCIHTSAQRNDAPPNVERLEPNRNNQGAESKSTKTNPKSISSPVTPTPVTPTREGNTNPKPASAATKRQRFANWLWSFTDPQPFSNLLLVIVGIGAFIIGLATLHGIKTQARAAVVAVKAVHRQTVATARSAKAAEDAILQADRHFRLAHQQWLDTATWTAEHIEVQGNYPNYIRVSFEFVNNTAMALTITGFRVKFLEDGGTWGVDTTGTGDKLIPGKSFPGDAPDFTIDLQRFGLAYNNELRMTVVGEVDFTDAMGVKQVQPFGRFIKGGNMKGNHKTWEWTYDVLDGVLHHDGPNNEKKG